MNKVRQPDINKVNRNDANLKVAILEPSRPLALCFQSYINETLEATVFSDGYSLLESIRQTPHQIVVVNSQLGNFDCLDLISSLKKIDQTIQFLVITKSKSPERIMQFIKHGVTNLLEHPITKEKLLNSIDNLVARIPSASANQSNGEKVLDEAQGELDSGNYYGFIGESERMQKVYQTIDSAAESKATVFITGESGTGKEVCASAIHSRSNRKHAEFVPINCAAIPRDLMESEIFGHVKGAFTGAHAAREGAATRANGGTLFLDEIGEMDLDLQSKLLRFIQTGTLQKVGSSKLETVDVRFVCATNRDPLEQVRNGTFREDLYYRLHVIPIYLPPLRERDRDILAIARSFLDRFSSEEARGFQAFSTETEQIMMNYHWPGNIRQLQNVVRNIVVLNNGDEVLPSMLPPPLNDPDLLHHKKSIEPGEAQSNSGAAKGVFSEYAASSGLAEPGAQHQGAMMGSAGALPAPNAPYPAQHHAHPLQQPYPNSGQSQNQVALNVIDQLIHDRRKDNKTEEDIKPLWEIEKACIEEAISICGNNIPKAANRLGVSPSTVYRKLHNWKAQGLM